nr:S1 family peptidase [Geodermatophilus sabuli]
MAASAAQVSASDLDDRGRWARPALGLAPIGPAQAHLAIRLAVKDDADVLLAGLDDAVLEEIDVRVIGAVRALSSPTPEELQRRTRPLHPGLSVAHPEVTAGTLGGFVRVGGRLAMLSNNHVLAASDAAAAGDPVLQPGPADGGVAADRVATLAAFARFSAGERNLLDAAVAVIDPEVPVEPGRLPGGPLTDAPVEVDDLDGEERVEKVGRTTGHTIGRITAVEVDGVSVQYDEAVLTFDDQVEIEGLSGPFSAGGDSGSVIWRSADRAPLGLLFAGSETGGRAGGGVTFANPMATVLSVLDLEWVAG